MSVNLQQEELESFCSRLIMRLHLLKSGIESFVNEQQSMKLFINQLPKNVINSVEKLNFLDAIESLNVYDSSEIDSYIDSLEQIDVLTWQEALNAQERYIHFLLMVTESISQVHNEFISILTNVSQLALRKAKAASRKKAPPPQLDPVKEYSTPHIAAMQAAINAFWLSYDENNLPSQKQVSNFIAEQIGEPIRNRMTDDLAKAIRPDLEK